ncbi:major surface protein MSP1a [Anaplasma marginale]|nr:major surface protein MSP1a [Anaplasma marginale]
MSDLSLQSTDSSSASGQQQESSVLSQSGQASTSSQLGADSSSASGQQQESSVSSQSDASTSSQSGADSSSASGQQQESSVLSPSGQASTSSQLGADSSSASGQQQESSVLSPSGQASTSSQLGVGADSSSASGQQQESSVSSQSDASTSSQSGTDWRQEMRSKVASVEYILAARALISVGVYAAQEEIAKSLGYAPLRVAEVEEIVRDSLVRSHFHDSGLSLGSIRLVLMRVGDKLGLQDLKIGEGYATYLAQAFADSVVVAADVQSGGGRSAAGLDKAIADVETSWSLHGGLISKDFDRGTKVGRGDLEAFVDFMFGGVSYNDANAAVARSVLETLAGHVDALGISYNQLDKLDADTLYSVVSFSGASAIDRGAVSDAADKFRVMMFGGAPAGQEKTAEPEHEAATPSASSVPSTVHGKVVDRAKEAAKQAYAGVRKWHVAKHSDTTTQLVVAITALLITAFAICACLEPRLIGASGPLIWGCLALVALLPLLGMAVHTAVSASSQKKAAGGAQRVAAQERSRELSRARQEDQQKLHVPAILTGLSVLVFIAAVVACIAVDAKRGTWQGSICFLAAFVLFAISAAVVMATRDQSLAEECDSKCATARTAQAVPGGQQQPRATEGVVSGGSQEGGASVPGTSVPSAGSGSVPPATIMVSVDPQLVATLGAGVAQAAA